MIPKLVLDLSSDTHLSEIQLANFKSSASMLFRDGYVFELCVTPSTKKVLASKYDMPTGDKFSLAYKILSRRLHKEKVIERSILIAKGTNN